MYFFFWLDEQKLQMIWEQVVHLCILVWVELKYNYQFSKKTKTSSGPAAEKTYFLLLHSPLLWWCPLQTCSSTSPPLGLRTTSIIQPTFCEPMP